MERQIGRWELGADKQREPVGNPANDTPFKWAWVKFSSDGERGGTQYVEAPYAYDDDHDVIHVWFPPLDFMDGDEEPPGIFVRRSIHDQRIVGLTILDYSKRDKEYLKAVLPWLDVGTLPSVERKMHR